MVAIDFLQELVLKRPDSCRENLHIMKSICKLCLIIAMMTSISAFCQNQSAKEVMSKPNHESVVYFVDKFSVPRASFEEFEKQMQYNRSFVRSISGLLSDQAMIGKDAEGNVTVLTIATWESKEHLEKAKALVQGEFKRINFNPVDFFQRLNVKMERQVYMPYQ
ncbi:MAG: hypothetical protein K2U26_10865 [Cyclobacteriaceae bacterium]|nr:hypothetical protein [Cyclobacteriaceae bacterium]